MVVSGMSKPVKVSDYANTCYIRTSWSSLNPSEGVYIWDDPNARLTKLIQSVLNRNMRLAFRIVVDGRDQGQNTPLYVFEAGANGIRTLIAVKRRFGNHLIQMILFSRKNIQLL